MAREGCLLSYSKAKNLKQLTLIYMAAFLGLAEGKGTALLILHVTDYRCGLLC